VVSDRFSPLDRDLNHTISLACRY